MFTGSEKIAQLLIERGADVNAVDKHNSSALIGAAMKGNNAFFSVVMNYRKCDFYCSKVPLNGLKK